jgi:hypothetical protein
MPRYVVDHKGSSVEVVTNFWSQKCRLLVDGKQVDSAAVPFVWGTTKLQDTGVSGVVVNVSTSWGVFPKVTMLAAGREIPMGVGRSGIGP